MTKVIGLLTTYQDETTLQGALDSLVHLDGSVIVEGAYQHATAAGQSPRSTDGTLSICRGYAMLQRPSCIVREANEEDDTAQRNYALNLIKEEYGTDNVVVFIIDGDEYYTKDQIREIKKWASWLDNNNYLGANMWSRVYYTESNYTLMIFPRLFNLTPSCYFFDDNRMAWPEYSISMTTTDRESENVKVLPVRLAAKHSSYNRGKERFEIKRQERISRHGHFVWKWDETKQHPIRTDHGLLVG